MADTSLVFNILAREKVSKTFDSIKAKAAIAGAAIGAALSAQLANALGKSKVDALLAAQLGAGPEMAARLGDITGNLYSRGVVDSVETAAGAIKATLQNSLVPKDAANEAIEQTSAMVANMAMILEEEADKVAGTVAQMVRTGIAKSTEEAFDILAAGAQRGANKAQDLLDTLNEYPTILRTFGLTGKEMTGLLVQGLQAGARDSDKVADALKELSLRAVDGSKTTKEAFEKLGLSAEQIAPMIAAGGPKAKKALQMILDKLKELKGTVKGAQVVQELFGGPGEDLGAAIFALNVDKAAESLGNVEGAAKKASQTLEQNAGAKVEAFKRKLEVGLTNALGTVAGLLMDNADLIKGLAIVLGPIIGVVGAVVGVVKAWSIAQSALNLVLSANPIVLVVLAIGTLITILILAWKNSETFRNVVTGAWNAIKSAAKAVGDWFRNTLWPLIKGVWDKISSSVVGLKNKIASTWNSVVSAASSAWQRVKSAIGSAVGAIRGVISWFGSLPGLIGGWFGRAKDAAVQQVSKLLSWIRGLPGRIKASLGNLGGLLFGAGRALIQGLINGVKSMVGAVVNAARGIASSAIQAAERKLEIKSPSKVFTWIGQQTTKGLVKGLMGGLSEVKSAVKTLTGTIMAAWRQRRISTDFASSLLTIVDRNNTRLKALVKQRESILKQMDAAREFAANITSNIKSFAALSAADFEGQKITAGTVRTSLLSKLNRIKRFAYVIRQLAKRGLHRSLLRQVIEAGPDEGLELAEALLRADAGTLRSISSAQASIDAAAKDLGAFSADALYDSGRQAGRGFLAGLLAQQREIEQAITRLATSLVNRIRKALKIKSPSQVMAWAGAMTGTGFVDGLLSTVDAVAAAGDELASAVMTRPGTQQRPVLSPYGAQGGRGGGEVVVRLVVDDTAQSDLLRLLRKMVRVEGRGNVQVAFGRG